MSKISDEMREWAELLKCSAYTKVTAEKINTIADRIDAEMVERPLAADGRPVVDGETLYDSDGCEYHVNKLSQLVNVSNDTYSGTRRPETLTHKRPDSLERIADELNDWRKGAVEERRIRTSDNDDVNDFIDRIRKFAKERRDE